MWWTSIGRTRSLAGLAAAAHLGCVAAGALHVKFQRALRPLAIYSASSGADSTYDFFAPGVLNDLRATFEMTDAAGGVTFDTLETGASREVDRRYKNLVSTFWMVQEDRSRANAFAASWAGRMLRRHPSAQQVTVRVDVYDLPSMAAWRDGRRPAWNPLYEASIPRKGRPDAAGAVRAERP